MQSIHRPCTAVCFLEFVKIVYKQNINLNKPKHNGVGLGKTVNIMSEDRLQLLVLVKQKNLSFKVQKNCNVWVSVGISFLNILLSRILIPWGYTHIKHDRGCNRASYYKPPQKIWAWNCTSKQYIKNMLQISRPKKYCRKFSTQKLSWTHHHVSSILQVHPLGLNQHFSQTHIKHFKYRQPKCKLSVNRRDLCCCNISLLESLSMQVLLFTVIVTGFNSQFL